MVAKVALFFLLDSSKARVPENYGKQVPVQKVAPFYDSLSQACNFSKLNFPDSTAYALSLFKKPYTTDIMVVVRDLGNATRSQLINSSRQQLAQVLNVGSERFHLVDYQYRALWLSKGVQRQEFVHMLESFSGELNADPDLLPRMDAQDYWLMNHDQGFIFGGKNEDDFTRAIIFFALAQAYHYQFGLQINRLSASSEQSVEALMGLRLEALRFRAHYFFGNPVKPGDSDAFATYAHIIRSLDLVPVEQELARKINDIGNLVQAKQARAQAPGATESVWPERDRFRTQPNKPGPREVAPLAPDAIPAPRRRRWLPWLLILLLVVVALVAGVVMLDEGRAALPSWLDSLLGMVDVSPTLRSG